MGSSDGQPAGRTGQWRPGSPQVLVAARCRACGRDSFPARPHCPGCWQGTDTVPLPDQGTLYTFTTVYAGRGDGEPPLALGYADFGGVRILGPLAGASPRIGATVTVAGAPADGSPHPYVFLVTT